MKLILRPGVWCWSHRDSSVVDESEQVIARYDDLYILRYETAVQSMNAYVYYQDKAEAV